jgi:hypothetical protein
MLGPRHLAASQGPGSGVFRPGNWQFAAADKDATAELIAPHRNVTAAPALARRSVFKRASAAAESPLNLIG